MCKKSVSQSVSQSYGQSVGRSVGRSVSQSVEILLNKKNLNFHINLAEGFMIDLKTFLGLGMPNQSCLDVTK